MAAAPLQRPRNRILPYLIGAVLVAIIAGLVLWLLWLLWLLLHGTPDIQRQRVIQQITVVQPPSPPPPPKPEEKIMEKQEEVVQPADQPSEKPVEKPAETPAETPSDAPPSTQAAGLDRAADAGSDSFHLSAGGGGGLFGRGGGGGLGGTGWGGFVEGHIRRALQRDPRTRTAKGFVRVAVDIDPNGRFSGAVLRSSTGDPKLDAAILDVLAKLPPLGRDRPAGREAQTNATINMKRTDG